jgi:hypothetical protein
MALNEFLLARYRSRLDRLRLHEDNARALHDAARVSREHVYILG